MNVSSAPSSDGLARVLLDPARELGGDVVQALFRLLKAVQIHALDNQSVGRQIDATVEAIARYAQRAGEDASLLFVGEAIFFAGRPLKASRAVYACAIELGSILERCGAGELVVAASVDAADLRAFAAAVIAALRDPHGRALTDATLHRVRLRAVSDAAVMRGLEVEPLDPEQRIVRTYANAVVILRHFFEQLARGEGAFPRRIKHLAQQLVDLSAGRTPAFLGVTAVRNAGHDLAGRAVNGAILAVAMARQLTDDRATLTRIAMAAMLHDVGFPRAAASQRLDTDGDDGAVEAALGHEADRALPAGTAAVLSSLGRLDEASMVRTVVAYEALHGARVDRLGALYRGLRAPTLHARIVRVARAFNELMTPQPGETPPVAADALLELETRLGADAGDRTVLRLLIASLGVVPPGTLVELSSGEIAVVTGGVFSALRVQLVLDASGAMVDRASAKGEELTLGPKAISRIVGSDPTFRRRSVVSPAPPPVTHVRPSAPLGPEDRTLVTTSSIVMIDDDETPIGMVAPTIEIGDLDEPGYESSPSITVAEIAPESAPEPAPAPPPAARRPSPDVHGSLATSPLPHLLVHMLSRGLTGSLVVRLDDDVDAQAAEASGREHLMRFVAGAPVRLRSALVAAPLGEVLVRLGSIAAGALQGAIARARRSQRLLGQQLLAELAVDAPSLDAALRAQMIARLIALSCAPVPGVYEFYADVDLLDEAGTSAAADEASAYDPLAVLLSVLREWNDLDRIDGTLARLGDQPLVLHPASELARFGLTSEERAVIDAAREFDLSYPSLLDAEVADRAVVRALVYALAITRHLVIAGVDAWPIGVARARKSDTEGATTPRPSSASEPTSVPLVAARPFQRSLIPAPPAVADAERTSRAPSVRVDVATPATFVTASGPSSARRPPPAASPELIARRKALVERAQSLGALDHYALLGVGPRATVSEVQTAFFAAAKTYHPDKLPPELADLRDRADAIFARLADAHRVLIDPTRRAAYDTQLQGGSARVDERDEVTRLLEASTCFQKAEIFVRRSDFARAEPFAVRAVELDPQRAEHVALLGWLRGHHPVEAPRVDEGLTLLDRALTIDLRADGALYFRGMLLKRVGRAAEALRDFKRAAELNPKNVDAMREVRLHAMRAANVKAGKGKR